MHIADQTHITFAAAQRTARDFIFIFIATSKHLLCVFFAVVVLRTVFLPHSSLKEIILFLHNQPVVRTYLS